MKKNVLRALMLSGFLALIPVTASALLIPLTASLDGAQEVPPKVTPATGSAAMTFDDVSNELDWDITFAGLTGPATAAHFHGPAPVGVNAAVQIPIPDIAGLTSGHVINSAILTNTQESQLLAGLWYINIHTQLYPGGEIRGQVNPVPEPSTLLLLGAGLAGVALAARFRAKPL